MQAQPVTPFVYEVVEPTTETTTVLDVVLGAAAVAGALAAVALVLGVVFAGLVLAIRRLRRKDGLTLGGSGLNLHAGG
jgi:hypothetical protein